MEISKCHLVCANCHRIRGHTGSRPSAPEHTSSLVSGFLMIAACTPLPRDARCTNFPIPELLGVVPDKTLADQIVVS